MGEREVNGARGGTRGVMGGDGGWLQRWGEGAV